MKAKAEGQSAREVAAVFSIALFLAFLICVDSTIAVVPDCPPLDNMGDVLGSSSGGVAEFQSTERSDSKLKLTNRTATILDSSLVNRPIHSHLLDSTSISALNKWYRFRLEWDIEKVSIQRTAYAWSSTASSTIFVFVHIFFIVAVIVSIIEFIHAGRLRRQAKLDEFKVSLEELAVKTTRLGTLLLLVALVLYLLFLRFVYPINLN